MSHKLRFFFTMFAMVSVSIIAYVFVHESGHALVAILCGAGNVRISIISAHAWWTGGSFTAGTEAFSNAAGAALPVCVSWTAMMFYSKENKSFVYHMIYFLFFVISISSILAWVVIPAYSIFAPFPDQTDDVVKFLNTSGISPVIVSLGGVIVILFSIFIAARKQLLKDLIQLAKDIRNAKRNREVEITVSNKSMAGIALAVLIAILVTALFELPDVIAKPIVSFSITDEVPAATYKTFDIQEENIYHFQTKLNAEGVLVDISISDQAQELVFQNLIYDQTDSNCTFYLSPGTYTLSVTYLTNADMFDRYCSIMDYHFEDWDMENFSSVYEHEAKLSGLFIELK